MAEPRAQLDPRKEIAAGLTLGAAGAASALCPDWRFPLLIAAAAVCALLSAWVFRRLHRWFLLFCALALLAPPLPLEAGSTGPHAAVLAAALGVCALLASNPALRPSPSSLGAALLAYLGVLALSAGPALWIGGARAGAESLVRTALLAISALAYLSIRHSSVEIDARRWIRGLLVLGFLTALIGCVDFALQLQPPAGFAPQSVWLSGKVMRRAQGMFYDAAQFGNVCAFFLIGVAAVSLRRDLGPNSRPFFALAGVTILAALVFSFSRGGLLAALAGLLLLAILERRTLARRGRLLAGAFLVAAASVGVVWFAAPELGSIYAQRFFYTSWHAVAAPTKAIGVRLDSWSRLLDLLADHPARLLLGSGYKTLAAGVGVDPPLIVDNQWLTSLGETGVIGIVALALLLAAILRGSWRAARSAGPWASSLGVWSLCFWAGQLAQMLFVDLLTYWRVLPVYLGVLALAEREASRPQARRPA
jgi:hypothetical protein